MPNAAYASYRRVLAIGPAWRIEGGAHADTHTEITGVLCAAESYASVLSIPSDPRKNDKQPNFEYDQ
jgi:hypothetical protein